MTPLLTLFRHCKFAAHHPGEILFQTPSSSLTFWHHLSYHCCSPLLPHSSLLAFSTIIYLSYFPSVLYFFSLPFSFTTLHSSPFCFVLSITIFFWITPHLASHMTHLYPLTFHLLFRCPSCFPGSKLWLFHSCSSCVSGYSLPIFYILLTFLAESFHHLESNISFISWIHTICFDHLIITYALFF